MSAASSKKPVALAAEVAALAKDFSLHDGKMALPEDAFLKWKAEHDKLPQAQKGQRGADVVALAVRFQREGGEAAREAIAQLYVLASHLLGEANAEASFKSAGVGWGPRPKRSPGGGGGWGSTR